MASSSKTPIGGLGSIDFTISLDSNVNHIPTSHTCTNNLTLSNDPDKESLKSKI
jgi:hypothetical protein